MNEELSPKIREQIGMLCRQLGKQRSLDAEGLEELEGHFEDRVLGYLHGDDAITEEDALVLAKAHFGIETSPTLQTFTEKTVKSASGFGRNAISGLVPLAATLFLAGVILDLVGWWIMWDLLGFQIDEYYFFWIPIAYVVSGLVLLGAASFTTAIRRKHFERVSDERVNKSALALIVLLSLGYSATSLPSARLGIWMNVTEVEPVYMATLVGIAMALGLVLVAVGFLRQWAPNGHVGSALACMTAWFVWHYATTLSHNLIADLAPWISRLEADSVKTGLLSVRRSSRFSIERFFGSPGAEVGFWDSLISRVAWIFDPQFWVEALEQNIVVLICAVSIGVAYTLGRSVHVVRAWRTAKAA